VRRVSERRVDLLVPGPEGGWLARALAQAGMVTFRREPGQPPSPRVGVVVVALSLEPGRSPRESFEAQLAQAREGLPAGTPLVALLPVDAQLDEGLRALAQGVYPRPVPVARLVHKIEALLDVAQGGAPRPSWSPSGSAACRRCAGRPAPGSGGTRGAAGGRRRARTHHAAR
jgi:hypothetical protein